MQIKNYTFPKIRTRKLYFPNKQQIVDMQQQKTFYSSQITKPYTLLAAKPTSCFNNQKQVFISFANASVSVVDVEKLNFSQFAKNMHQKRINFIKERNNVLITASNDFTVKLWDKATAKCIHTFQKPGSQFNCFDFNENILSAAHTSKLVFWDLRKMKQTSEFNESFNGEITSIQFDPLVSTSLMGCSVDGMINKFDLKQSEQEQAFEWCTKLLQCPSKIQFINNVSLVQTTGHNLFLLEQEAIKKKIVLNNFEQPTHILNSRLIYKNNEYSYQYFTWNLEKQLIQKYINDQVVGYVSNVQDSEIFVPLTNKKVLYVSENGETFIKNIQSGDHKNRTKNNPNQKQHIKKASQNKFSKWQKIQEQHQQNKNGFILNKPSSFKQKTKKFKPY